MDFDFDGKVDFHDEETFFYVGMAAEYSKARAQGYAGSFEDFLARRPIFKNQRSETEPLTEESDEGDDEDSDERDDEDSDEWDDDDSDEWEDEGPDDRDDEDSDQWDGEEE